jgi:hypothetical protein
MRFSAGRQLNHLARCYAVPTMTPAADALFPATFVYDSRASRAAGFGSIAADSRFDVDLNLGSGAATQDITCRAGEQLRLVVGGGAAPTLENLATGKALAGDGTWAAGQTLNAAGTFSATVESLTACGGDPEPVLRLTLNGGAVALWPLTDFAALVGHSIPARLVPKLYSSPTGAFAGEETLEATFTARRGQMHVALAAASVGRYWRLVLTGTPITAPKVGEIILAQGTAFTRAPLTGVSLEPRERQARVETGLGGEEVYLDGGGAPERATMSWLVASHAEWAQIRDQLYETTRGGAYHVLLWSLAPLGTGWFCWGRLRDSLPQQLQDLLGGGEVAVKVDVEVMPEPWPLA